MLKDIVVDFWREHLLLIINSAAVEHVTNASFSQDLSWNIKTISLYKKSPISILLSRKLSRARVLPPIMYSYYTGTIASILTSCISMW